jgi:Protein of unknown function (DUF2721)
MGGFSQAQAMIAAMITPALLILASGSLIATALVRLARVVDRVRKIAESGRAPLPGELLRLERRALAAERAVGRYFVAIVCFVVAGMSIALDHASGDRFSWAPVAVTTIGMLLIVDGSARMLEECRLGTSQIRAEIASIRSFTDS